MKHTEKLQAIELRKTGYSISEIAEKIGVAKSSISIWVREVELTATQQMKLQQKPFTNQAIERRRIARLKNELAKRNIVITNSSSEVPEINRKDLWLMGVMLYWAEGGKTQRMVRFSNGDPEMIKMMMKFFRIVCRVPEQKFRGYIHIHPHLSAKAAEEYWSEISNIPVAQFFKTYNKRNKSSLGKKDSLPHGVMDIYVMDSSLFLKIAGWAKGIFENSTRLR